jgi:hypothetical protein
MDFLAAADQADDDTPLRYPLGKFDEVLGLGLATFEPRGA